MKKEKQTYHSFVEDNQKFMQCKKCYQYTKTSEDSVAVTCELCITIININNYPDSLPKNITSSGNPPGWHFMKEFVDTDGNVFHKGKDQPKLKGTLKPTVIKPKIKTKKKKVNADAEMFKQAKAYKKKQIEKRKARK